MKKTINKWILLVVYILSFPIALQISFIIKRFIGTPLFEYIDSSLQYPQLVPVYMIFICILLGLFIAFMIVFSRNLATKFKLGMSLPISIVSINILLGIPLSTMKFSYLSYFFNAYDTKSLYIAICILLVMLIADKKLYGKAE